jgi:aerobic carbon-monoxide dehydrogenase small subunit
VKTAFELNGEAVAADTAPDRRVVDLLREDLGLTGTKEGCGSGECGACTVLVDGRTRLSCLMLAAQLEGRKVTTVEGLESDGQLYPVQRAFMEHGAVQCGFCTPGMVLTAADLLDRGEAGSREQVRLGISGNLCRCTGYQKIVDAVMAAAARPEEESPST